MGAGHVYDVIIIGAGSAGLSALREVRKQTPNFLLIHDGPLGTTCARVGCMPSKALIESANAFYHRNRLEEFGISGAERLDIDIQRVMRRVRRLRDRFADVASRAVQELPEHNLVLGRAHFVTANIVAVGDRQFTAERIIIATGSRPYIPEAWQAFSDRILTSDNLFEQDQLPYRVGMIGLGAIGIEIAQSLARMGIEVIAFSADTTLAGLTDGAVSECLQQQLQDEFALHLGAAATVEETADGISIRTEHTQVNVGCLIAALGRRPNVEGLHLEALGVPLDARGLPSVDPATLQIPGTQVYMAGDANGDRSLLHEGVDEGHIAGINAVREQPLAFQRRVPLLIVFSDPEVALVGARYVDLDPQQICIGRVDFRKQSRAITAETNVGLLHIYADRYTGVLLGAEMCAPAAEHMGHLLALAIDRKLTVQELLRMPFYHPVLEEGLRSGLRNLAAQLGFDNVSDLDLLTS